MELPIFDLQTMLVGLFVFLRVSLIIVMLPVLGQGMVPPQVKMGLAALLSVVLYPIAAPDIPPMPDNIVDVAVIVIKEVLLAGMLGLLAQLIFSAAQLAGQIVSYQMGLAVANIFDPLTQGQVAVTGQFASTVAMLMWLSVGAHHAFLLGMAESFHTLPIGAPWSFHGWAVLDDAAASIFVMAIRLVAPVMLLVLFVNAALGLLSRAVPQIQVFFVGMPISIGLGMFAFALSLPAFAILLKDGFSGLGMSVMSFLHILAAPTHVP